MKIGLFSWKFIETYLIQPRDDKGDNLSVNKLARNNKYYLVAIDSDLTFGYKILNLKEEPNTYSLIYLLNAMNNKLNPAVIQMYLNLDLDKLILDWVKYLKENNFIKNLFNDDSDLKRINRLKGYKYNGYCSTCNLNE